jgi:hypothetical protein
MANTFIKIASVTVGSGGAASIAFTSIPATYTDLLLKVSARSTTGGGWSDASVTFNGGTTYSSRYLYGDSSAANSGNNASEITTRGAAGNSTTANTFGNTDIYIPNYAGSASKSVSIDDVTENNSGATNSAITHLLAGLSASTTAINSVTLTMGSGNYVQYSTATLYGISKS